MSEGYRSGTGGSRWKIITDEYNYELPLRRHVSPAPLPRALRVADLPNRMEINDEKRNVPLRTH
jgi:hypothetical protein